jgi:hypothetical protein
MVKGLLVSLLTFALFVVAAAVTSHILRLKRHLHMFALVALACGGVYFILYHITPQNCYILPRDWMASSSWFDQLYGLIVLLLNCHSFVDCFFASCGGFSVSMLMAILKTDGRSITTPEMVAKFKTNTGTDRIYGWRIPYLEAKGHIYRDPGTQSCKLTTKGRVIASLAFFAKRLMNLGEGG